MKLISCESVLGLNLTVYNIKHAPNYASLHGFEAFLCGFLLYNYEWPDAARLP